ncbi:MAG: ATPase domain protein [Acidobacteriaceae bacterium]|nr:ATPase domain protein [Acidobacteriaceae bacterium]
MFERYTEKARRVIFFARYEASHYGSPDIETEHLLLGVLREDKPLTARFLKTPGAADSIRQQIDDHATVREAIPTSVDLPLSKESIHVLHYAAEEAQRLSHPHIGTEHLLLGLLREEKCFAAELLAGFDVRLEQVRMELDQPILEEQKPVTDRIKQRLAELGVTLPAPPAAGGNYLSAKQVGPMLYLAGVVSTNQGEVITGTVGADKTLEEAYAAARACALTQLAVILRETGSLDAVESIVSVNGYVCCVAGFPDSPRVINGASDLLVEIFADAGRHVRAAVGVNALPRNALVELQMTVLLHE